MLNWYLVQLKPNGHKLAKANLERQGFNTFLPLQNVTKRTAQKFMDRTVPLFAGYMFVELDVAQNSWRKVNSTLGVARIVSLGGTPTPVPYSIMNQLISRCDRDGILRPSQGVVVGQDVQVLRGPFSNFVAKVEEIESDRRVWVLIDMLGQSSRIFVSADAVAHVG
jgi:transcriptional antiterminator RfaH